jgi:hypothetical protein
MSSYKGVVNTRNEAEARGVSCERKWALFRRKHLDHLKNIGSYMPSNLLLKVLHISDIVQ